MDIAPWKLVLGGLAVAFVLFVLFGLSRKARLYAPDLKALDDHAAEWARQRGAAYARNDDRLLDAPHRTHPRGFSTTPTKFINDDDPNTPKVSPDSTFGGVTVRPSRAVQLNSGIEHAMHWRAHGMPITAFQLRQPNSAAAAKPPTSHFWQAFKFSYWQVVLTRLPKPLPSLAVLPGNRIYRAALSPLGYRDLTLEYHDFNRQYFVASSDDRFSYDALMPQTMEWLRRLDLGPQIFLVIDGDVCRIMKAQPMKLEDLEPQAEVLAGFVRSLPRRVWEQ